MAQKKWTIDPAHSEVQFKVKHLVISTVTGNFKTFEGTASTEEDTFQDGSITVTIDAQSINTNNEQRDGHLKSAEFFDVENTTKIIIKTTSIRQTDDDEYIIQADLTMRGVTKAVEFKAEYGGIVTDGYGQTKVGLEVKGKINRKDFGLNWNAIIEGGGLTVSEEVKLIANLQFIQEK